jgi:DNA-directed RNA polymerase subunit beta'
VGPLHPPIITEKDGKVGFEDLVEGFGAETADEATGITKRVVIDWRGRRAVRT